MLAMDRLPTESGCDGFDYDRHVEQPIPLEAMDPVTTEGEPATTSSVIVLDHVSKRFGDFVAVHDADFSIGRGQFFSMLGPSGCGKTTTLRMIAGFEAPTEGRILLEGEDVSRTPPYRRNVNTVFQQYALFPHMNVFDNVAFGLRSKKFPKRWITESVGEMLEIVRMGDFAKRRPAQLSGGQQQRVALARALVNRPDALLLDEPLAALDLKLRQAMQLELKRIQRDTQVTFIFVTHDQQEALTMSDHIAVMSDGWVEQIGSPTEIYNRPATPFVAGFIGEANLLPGTLQGRQGDVATVAVAGGTIAVPNRRRPTGPVLVMVRPEKVHVGGTAPDQRAGGGAGDGRRGHLPRRHRARGDDRRRRHGDGGQPRRRSIARAACAPATRRGRAGTGRSRTSYPPPEATPRHPLIHSKSSMPSATEETDHDGIPSRAHPGGGLVLTRRAMLGRLGVVAGAGIVGPTLLAACGDDDDDERSGGGGGDSQRAVVRQLAGLHRRGDRRPVHGGERARLPLHRGLQRQQRVLRQGPG